MGLKTTIRIPEGMPLTPKLRASLNHIFQGAFDVEEYPPMADATTAIEALENPEKKVLMQNGMAQIATLSPLKIADLDVLVLQSQHDKNHLKIFSLEGDVLDAKDKEDTEDTVQTKHIDEMKSPHYRNLLEQMVLFESNQFNFQNYKNLQNDGAYSPAAGLAVDPEEYRQRYGKSNTYYAQMHITAQQLYHQFIGNWVDIKDSPEAKAKFQAIIMQLYISGHYQACAEKHFPGAFGLSHPTLFLSEEVIEAITHPPHSGNDWQKKEEVLASSTELRHCLGKKTPSLEAHFASSCAAVLRIPEANRTELLALFAEMSQQENLVQTKKTPDFWQPSTSLPPIIETMKTALASEHSEVEKLARVYSQVHYNSQDPAHQTLKMKELFEHIKQLFETSELSAEDELYPTP